MSSSSENKPHLVILGAGVCGLYAALTALRKGLRVTVLEKSSQVGGLAAGHQIKGNNYDTGVHMLHAFDEEIFTDLSDLMGEKRIDVPLDARIRWKSSTYRYPLKFADLIKEMPLLTLLHGVSGLLYAELKRAYSNSTPTNAEEALIDFYGKPLYRFFFEDFTHRYWGIHPKELSAEFVKRKMPRLSAVDFFRKQIARFLPIQDNLTTESSINDEVLSYSKEGAAAMVASMESEIKKLGGTIEKETTIKNINLNSKVVTYIDLSGNEKTISTQHIINTIPLNTFISICSEVPATVTEAAKQLRYKPIAIYGLLLNKPKAIDGLYIYYRNKVFHRVGEPKNAGLKVTPEEATVLIVETTCEQHDEKWNASDTLKQKVIDDLEAESICTKEEILEWHTLTNPNGYPVFDKGFEAHLALVQQWLEKFSYLKSTGRQGAFTYPAMHSAMRMGSDAVHQLVSQKN